MAKGKRPRLSASLKWLREQIEHWRRTRVKRREMPADLWSAAAALARIEGAYPVARALRVNYDGLKRRMAECTPPDAAAPANGFVELRSGQLLDPPAATTVIECSDESGARMTVRLASDAEVDVARLVAAFRQRDDR